MYIWKRNHFVMSCMKEEKKTLDQEMKILSVVIQKGNARMLVSRQTFPSHEEIIPDINM